MGVGVGQDVHDAVDVSWSAWDRIEKLIESEKLGRRMGIEADDVSDIAKSKVRDWIGRECERLREEGFECLVRGGEKKKTRLFAWDVRVVGIVTQCMVVLYKDELDKEIKQAHQDVERLNNLGKGIEMLRTVSTELETFRKLSQIASGLHQVSAQLSSSKLDDVGSLLCFNRLVRIAFGSAAEQDIINQGGNKIFEYAKKLTHVESAMVYACALLYLSLGTSIVGVFNVDDLVDVAKIYATHVGMSCAMRDAVLGFWLIDRADVEQEDSVKMCETAVKFLSPIKLTQVFPHGDCVLDGFFVMRLLCSKDQPALAHDFLVLAGESLIPDTVDDTEVLVSVLLSNIDWHDSENNQIWRQQWQHLMYLQRHLHRHRDIIMEMILQCAWSACYVRKAQLSELFLKTPFTLDESKYLEMFLQKVCDSGVAAEVHIAFDFLIAYYLLNNFTALALACHRDEEKHFPQDKSNRLAIRHKLIEAQVNACTPPDVSVIEAMIIGSFLTTLPSKNRARLAINRNDENTDEMEVSVIETVPLQVIAEPVKEESSVPAFFQSTKKRTKNEDAPRRDAPGGLTKKPVTKGSSTPVYTGIHTRRRRPMPMPGKGALAASSCVLRTSETTSSKRRTDTSPSVIADTPLDTKRPTPGQTNAPGSFLKPQAWAGAGPPSDPTTYTTPNARPRKSSNDSPGLLQSTPSTGYKRLLIRSKHS